MEKIGLIVLIYLAAMSSVAAATGPFARAPTRARDVRASA
jgi:hypothetical protein